MLAIIALYVVNLRKKRNKKIIEEQASSLCKEHFYATLPLACFGITTVTVIPARIISDIR